MAIYHFADLVGGALAFVPAEDRLHFAAGIAAARLAFAQSGPDLLVTAPGGTLRLLGTTLGGSGVGAANLVFADGSQVIADGVGNNLRNGTAGGDWIAVDRGGTDTVRAGAGDDRIEAGAALDAADRLDGGDGSGDVLALGGTLSVTLAPATITGIERIEVRTGLVTLVLDDATVATATLAPGALFTVDATAQGGGSRLAVDGGAVVAGGMALLGGAGDDSLLGGVAADRLLGGAGDDTLHGGAGDDTIAGGAGADWLVGGAGEDLFLLDLPEALHSTPASPDTILGFEGAGQAGGDRIRLPDPFAIGRVLAFHVAAADFAFEGYAESGQQLPASRIGDGFADVLWRAVDGEAWQVEIWADLDDDGRFGTADLFLRIVLAPGDGPAAIVAEDFDGFFGALFGGAGPDALAGRGATDDVIFGEGGDDSLSGGDGVDVLHGGAGDDTLHGGDLADLLHGGPGSDRLDGGDGWDTLFAADPLAPETESPDDRNTLTGGARPDMLFGGIGLDTLDGGDGDDFLWGDGGADSLAGGDGDDRLFGGGGADRLDGGAGDDTLAGGPGADTMTGGAGADLFVLDLALAGDPDSGGAAPDWITDFDQAQGDILSLGLTDGLVTGRYGLGPLVWRGALAPRDLAAGLPIGLALPGGGIGPGYYQAWWLPAVEGGGWFVLDLDQDLILDADDMVIRLGGPGAGLALTPAAFAPGTFRTRVGTAAADTLAAAAEGQEVFGLAGDDLLVGGDGPDRLLGGDGQDTLRGGAGNDQLWGGAGDDRLEGGEGDDELFVEGPGMQEVDGFLVRSTLLGGAGDDSLWGADGRDWQEGGAGRDRLYGGVGADTLLGGEGDDTIQGGDGADSIAGGPGADSIDAGSGDDTVTYDPADPLIDGGDDSDLLILNAPAVVTLGNAAGQVAGGGIVLGFEAVDASGATGAVTITGSDGANRLVGSGFADRLEGGDSNDTLDGGAGHDTLTGGNGNDVFRPGTGADSLHGGPGRDTVSYAESATRVSVSIAGVGLGSIGAAGDTLIAFEAVIGTSFADSIGGTALDDWLDGGPGYDHILAFAGNDTLVGGAGFNTLYGGVGNDSIVGGPNAETLDGGDGNDTIIAGGGIDHMWGGAGNDTFFLFITNSVIYEGADRGDDTVWSAASWHLRPNIEWFLLLPGAGNLFAVGQAGSERIVGNDGNNLLIGADGNDTIWGGAGVDRIFGDAGADRLFGEDGNDIIYGGDGNDTIEGGNGSDHLHGEAGNDTLLGGDDASADVLRGGAGDDWLDGGGGADAAHGGLGNDTMVAGQANDRLYENPGEGWDVVVARFAGSFTLTDNVEELRLDGTTAGIGNALSNRITGSFRDETLIGGEGADTLVGAGGNDILFGQAGRDAFVFGPGSGLDVVADFERGFDRILLQGHGFTHGDQVLALTRDAPGGAIIDLAPGASVQLAGVAKAALLATDFVFLA
jgi:Ca2+-binding RTX toxin-like protein